jgi:hypothetical protein
MSWDLTHQSQGGFTLLEMILGPEAAQKGVTNREGAAVRPFVSLSSFGLPTRWLNRCPIWPSPYTRERQNGCDVARRITRIRLRLH